MMDYTPQREWIERQGLVLWLAFFFTEIGAGLYLISLFFAFWRGCLAGLLISAILGGGFHMLYLGKPERAWRAILRPAKSELSRGLVIMLLFVVVGAIQIAPTLSSFSLLPWQPSMLLLKLLMAVLSFFVISHGFMTMNVISAIPFWNSAILPVLSVASGVWLGTQLAMGLGSAFSNKALWLSLDPVARWSLFVYAFLIIYYFWNAGHATPAVKKSLRVILKGDLSVPFYVCVVLIGLVIPIAISLYYWGNGLNQAKGLLYLRMICALIGDVSLRYTISKSGRYSPLIYSNAVHS